VLRVPSNFHLTLAREVRLTCKEAAARLLAGDHPWEVRSAGKAPEAARPDQPPLADPGMIPLTVPETGRLLAHPPPPGLTGRWLDWRRRHQARSAWYHQRTRLARDADISLVS
jgi:hypothetical protein